MHMSFYFSSKVYDFLFYGVNITTTWGMVSLCLGLVSLSILAEGFKVARSQLLKVAMSRRTGCTKYEVPERSPLLMSQSFLGRRNEKLLYKRRIKFHILQSFLHVIHLTIGYILMLIVMTYNAYFSIAIVGGAGLGYFFFALFDLPSKILGTSRTVVKKQSTSHAQGAEVGLLQGQEKTCSSAESQAALCSPQEPAGRDQGDCSSSAACGSCGDSSCGGCTLHRQLDAVAIQAPDTFNPV
ncbi:high affinity copper uptake protein 1-like isoform X3 [Penaeus chinensis]|uniref:high affinity copper uptake protein 1-like isoform X3 n=1 Tax=Penaeus chinensis TaxID=139456 RepID=UPI001FB76C5E|nr:high affinity copper uptake protein 1-like isoform X3 [Penaeus chinensis]